MSTSAKPETAAASAPIVSAPGAWSVEGWLVSAIVHCSILLVLALWAFPISSTIFDSMVLELGPESNASEALFTLDSDPVTFEATENNEQLVTVEPVLPLVLAADVPSQEIATSELPSIKPQDVDLDIGGDSAKEGDAVFFGTSASGRDFVFILDCSGSMRARANERFFRARDELINSISKLRTDQRFYVYLFNWSTFPMFGAEDPGTLIDATGENISKLRAWLYNIEPDSGTDPRRAIRGSIAMQPDAIFLLSDGKFNRPSSTDLLRGWDSSPSTVFDIFSGANPPKVQVNAIAFEDAVSATGMEKLAQITEGQFRFVPAPGVDHGSVDTTIDRSTLPTTPEEKLELAKKVLLIRRAEKLVERNLTDHAVNLVQDIDENSLPAEVRQRLRRIRRGKS